VLIPNHFQNRYKSILCQEDSYLLEAIKALRRIGAYQNGDERILGDSDFIKKVLAQAKDNFERKYHLKSNGFNFEKVLGRVAELLDLKPEQVLAVGKYKKTVAARSLLCF